VVVYPNPAHDHLTIQIEKSMEIQRVELLSAIGTSISSYPAGTNQIDLSNLSNGTYFVRINTATGGQHVMRFIKQ
jgi:hypothetical protein